MKTKIQWKDSPNKDSQKSLKRITISLHQTVTLDGVAMGSPLVPLLANIFMTSFEEDLMPIICNWKRYVNDRHAYVEPTKA